MHQPPAFRISLAVVTTASLVIGFLPGIAFAATPSFSDVPETNPEFAAVEYLKSQGILQGYSDGTFRPSQTVKRAEALKILVATKLTADQIATYTKTSYTDIPAGVWYAPYVQAALEKFGLIDGPPKTTEFHGDRTISRAEFLKLLFKSQGVDTTAFSEITLPLASDVSDGTAWFYASFRYAIASSVIQVGTDGKLHPEQELTRGELAQQLYRLANYQAGKRTQALLSEEESELVNVLEMLDKKQFPEAQTASVRALISARGALLSKPDVAIVQAAVKIASAFRDLVDAYKAGTDGKLNDVLTLTKDAWAQADKAQQISPSLQELSTRVQTIAKAMADQARTMLKTGSSAPAAQ